MPFEEISAKFCAIASLKNPFIVLADRYIKTRVNKNIQVIADTSIINIRDSNKLACDALRIF